MEKDFLNHIKQKFPFLKEKKLILAISGGLDSVVLLFLLHKYKFTFELAHCNFNLRGSESDADQMFIEQLGKKLSLKTHIQSFETTAYATHHKVSIQIAARELRYAWFNKLVEANNFDYLLTAHHADDSLETFLINLSRGTGINGLVGIPEQTANIIRPLLPFTRAQILAFAKANNISWREDSSNLETKYLRNKIRHEIIPLLKSLNPSFLVNFLKTTQHLKDSQKVIETWKQHHANYIIHTEKDIVTISIEKLLKLEDYKSFLYHFLKDYGFTQWDDIYNLVAAQTGKKVFSKSYLLLKNRENLLLSKKDTINTTPEELLIPEGIVSLTEPIHLTFKEDNFEFANGKTAIKIDKKLVSFPLILRRWKAGDYFYPIKMNGKKKISKYFKDEKLSEIEKRKTWLLCSGHEIIWVVGMRQDKRFLSDSSNNENNILISIN